ncbi:hypothetical protein Tco_1116533 [Tanacetum coccineum]
MKGHADTEPRSLVVRITKQGYNWPLMPREVAKAIEDYEKCKEQSAIRKAGTSGAISAGSTWPFSHWGIHILGPLPMAPEIRSTLNNQLKRRETFQRRDVRRLV